MGKINYKDRVYGSGKKGKNKKPKETGKKVISGMLFATACFIAVFVLLEFHSIYWLVAVTCAFLMLAAFFFLDSMFGDKEDIFDELTRAQEELDKAREEDRKKADEDFKRRIEEQVASLDKTGRAMFAAMKKSAEAQDLHLANMQDKINQVITEQNAGLKTMIKFNKENARQMALSEKATLEELATKMPSGPLKVSLPKEAITEELSNVISSKLDAIKEELPKYEAPAPQVVYAAAPAPAPAIEPAPVFEPEPMAEEAPADLDLDSLFGNMSTEEPAVETAAEENVPDFAMPEIPVEEDIPESIEEPADDTADLLAGLMAEEPVTEENEENPLEDVVLPEDILSEEPEIPAEESVEESNDIPDVDLGAGLNEEVDPLAEILAGMSSEEPPVEETAETEIPDIEIPDIEIPEEENTDAPAEEIHEVQEIVAEFEMPDVAVEQVAMPETPEAPEPEPIPEPEPAPAPAAEPEAPKSEKELAEATGVDLSNPNANLTPEDIAKLFAASGN